jgi:hypothetical protein
VENAGEPGGGQADRGRQVRAEHRHAEIWLGHVAQYPGLEPPATQRPLVGAQRDFLIGRAIDVAENRPGQPALRGSPEVIEVVAPAQDPAVAIHLEITQPHQFADLPGLHVARLPVPCTRPSLSWCRSPAVPGPLRHHPGIAPRCEGS